ncbi:protein fem-1 homolog C-like [Mizuhopecten yessoensis]|uniref:Protein fem-1-like C n=1 Tax=Mizuhopecten yessoensis TaxID=6573 RepID=A0A210QNS1_MIZYE|nr:protein fem-1 homolog C-like [Mizuhopecten yessoensis]OWF50379.1 Protein fem-1-like C [Mizuhopecten yessoensis]
MDKADGNSSGDGNGQHNHGLDTSGEVTDQSCNGQVYVHASDETNQPNVFVGTGCNQARQVGYDVDTTAPPGSSHGSDDVDSLQPQSGRDLVNGAVHRGTESGNEADISDSGNFVISNITPEDGPVEERVSYIPNSTSSPVDVDAVVIPRTAPLRNLNSVDTILTAAESIYQEEQRRLTQLEQLSENQIGQAKDSIMEVERTEQSTEEIDSTELITAEVGSTEPASSEVGSTKLASSEVGSTKPASSEVGSTEQISEEDGSTEQDAKEAGNTKQKSEEVNSYKQPLEDVNGTELTSEDVSGTEQPSDDVGGTEQPSEDISGTEQTSKDVSGTERTSEDVNNTEQTSAEEIVNFRKVVQEFLDGIKDQMSTEEQEGPDTTESLAAFVLENIASKNIRTIRYALRDLPKADRKAVVDYEIDGKAALFVACEKGTEEMVKYFVVECGADTNKKGKYDCGEKDMLVAPLWLATIEEKPEVVKILAENGADVNAVCETGSTAVHAACYMNNIELVKTLCNNGSDVNIPDTLGSTCLKDSVDNLEICKILVTHGADLNYRKENQYSILHHAIKAHNMETVELLVRNGAGIMIKDFEGNDCLRYAVLVYAPDIVELLMDSIHANAPKSADIYDLMGAMAVGKGDYKEGYEFWLRAMYIRTELHGGETSLREIPEIFGKDVDVPNSISDLISLAKNCDAMDALSLAITSHQLGPTHWDTIQRILLQSTSLLHNDDLVQAFDMTRYVYSLLLNKYTVLHRMQEFALSQLFEICSKFQIQTLRGVSIPRFKDILEVFRDMIDFLEKAHLLKQTNTQYFIQNSNVFDKVISHVFDMIYLLKDNNKSSEEKAFFNSQMRRLVGMDLCDINGMSLLHKALTRKPKLVFHFMEQGPREGRHEDLCVTRELIQAGANVNVQDLKRDTPLHSHLKWIEKFNFFTKKVIELFLDYGIHVDLIDIDNNSLFVMIKVRGITLCPVKYHTLQCLAVKVIRDHDIRFRAQLPIPLQRFVDMHK